MELYFTTANAVFDDLPIVLSWFKNDPEGFTQWTGEDFVDENALSALKELSSDPAVSQTSVYNDAQELLAYYELHHQADRDYLVRFVVNPEMRGKGIGREVLKKVISQSTTQLALIVYRANTAAMALYSGLGFVQEDANEETMTLALNAETASF